MLQTPYLSGIADKSAHGRALPPAELLPLVPIDADVLRRPSHGHDVSAAISVQVSGGCILDGHPGRIDELAVPGLPVVRRIIDSDSTGIVVALLVANADH